MQKRKQVKTKVCFDEKKSACENSLYENTFSTLKRKKKKKKKCCNSKKSQFNESNSILL